MISVSGDVNAKSNNWCKNDATFHEGSMVDAVTSNYGLHQLIQEPTHITRSVLVLTLFLPLNQNLVMESGVHSSLHPNCCHQVVFAKFKFFILYQPPCERSVWFYEKADVELIRKVANEFDWTRALSNAIVDEKVCYFTKTLLNIIHNFIPHERIICDDRDSPWINKDIKKQINKKNSAYKSYCRTSSKSFKTN